MKKYIVKAMSIVAVVIAVLAFAGAATAGECPKCGIVNDERAKFCRQCARDLRQETPEEKSAKKPVKYGPPEKLALLTRQIAEEPNSHLGYYNRGIEYLRRDDFKNAIGDFSTAIEMNPQADSAYFYRGIANFMAGEFDRASADYDDAVAINERSGEDKPDLAAMLCAHNMAAIADAAKKFREEQGSGKNFREVTTEILKRKRYIKSVPVCPLWRIRQPEKRHFYRIIAGDGERAEVICVNEAEHERCHGKLSELKTGK